MYQTEQEMGSNNLPTDLSQDQKSSISVIVPFLNERESLARLCGELTSVLNRLDRPYEIILVDDGSTDKPMDVLGPLIDQLQNLTLIQLRKNFGKSAALAAGFDTATGATIITLDADLQDDPKEIPQLLDRLAQGYDMVVGYKKVRHDPWHKVIPSRVFNFLISHMTTLDVHDINCGFKCFQRQVADEIEVYGDLHRFIPLLAHWKGFSISEIEVQHRPRIHGASKFGLNRFHAGFIDLITALFLLHYGTKPARVFGLGGLLLGAVGIVILTYLTVLWFMGMRPIGNRPLFFLGILLVLVGCQFVAMGLLSELQVLSLQSARKAYSIGKIYKKNRERRA